MSLPFKNSLKLIALALIATGTGLALSISDHAAISIPISFLLIYASIILPKQLLYIGIATSLFARFPIGSIGIVKILPCEIAIFALSFTTVCRLAVGTREFKITKIDYIIFVYILYNLIIAIFISPDLYTSLRNYRHNILLPFLIFYLYNYYINDIKDIEKGIFLLICSSIPFSLFGIYLSVLTHERPAELSVYVSLVTLSLLNAIFLVYLIYCKKNFQACYGKYIWVFFLIINFASLILTATRAPFIGLLVGLLATSYGLKKVGKTAIVSSFFVILFACIIFTALYAPEFNYGAVELEKSFTRLLGLNEYTIGLDNRMIIWKFLLEKAMEAPFFGYGYAYSEIVPILNTAIAHPHNFLLNALFQSGITGLTILIIFLATFLGLIVTAYKNNSSVYLSRTTRFCFSAFLIFVVNAFFNDIWSGGRSILFFLILAICYKVWLLTEKGYSKKYARKKNSLHHSISKAIN